MRRRKKCGMGTLIGSLVLMVAGGIELSLLALGMIRKLLDVSADLDPVYVALFTFSWCIGGMLWMLMLCEFNKQFHQEPDRDPEVHWLKFSMECYFDTTGKVLVEPHLATG